MHLPRSLFLCLSGTTGNVLSFSETRAHQVVQQKSEQFMIYNQKQLTRIYPSAYRIDSSNFNPLPYWNAGCQLGVYDPRGVVLCLLSPPGQLSVVSNPLKRSIFTVALNYQSEGRMMQINRAKFKANGNCGYILKPQQMCKGKYWFLIASVINNRLYSTMYMSKFIIIIIIINVGMYVYMYVSRSQRTNLWSLFFSFYHYGSQGWA